VGAHQQRGSQLSLHADQSIGEVRDRVHLAEATLDYGVDFVHVGALRGGHLYKHLHHLLHFRGDLEYICLCPVDHELYKIRINCSHQDQLPVVIGLGGYCAVYVPNDEDSHQHKHV
jgi:hypothetical protein